MKKILISSLLIGLIVVFACYPIVKECSHLQNLIMGSKERILHAQQTLDILQSREDRILSRVDQYYSRFLSRITHDADTYGYNVKVEIISNSDFDKKNASMVFEGIKRFAFRISFFKIQDPEEIFRILRHYKIWQQQFPIIENDVAFKDNMLQINGGVYGA